MSDKRLSVLRLQHAVFDKIQFERKGFKNGLDDSDNVQLNFTVGVDEESSDACDKLYRVALGVTASKKEEYEAEVRMSGYFTLENADGVQVNEAQKELLLKQNAVAILFPYVRSELTLLTAQPETEPLIVPVMNISEMVKVADENGQE